MLRLLGKLTLADVWAAVDRAERIHEAEQGKRIIGTGKDFRITKSDRLFVELSQKRGYNAGELTHSRKEYCRNGQGTAYKAEREKRAIYA